MRARGRRFSQRSAWIYRLLQLTLALHYIHDRHSIIHRDLKTQNVFLMADGTTLRLGDFGVSRVLDSRQQFNPRAELKAKSERYAQFICASTHPRRSPYRSADLAARSRPTLARLRPAGQQTQGV